MNSKRRANPILVILIVAVAMVGVTFLGIRLFKGIKVFPTTLSNGAKFLGEWEGDQPISGTIKYQDDNEATLDYFSKTITYANGDIYVGDIVGGCKNGRGIMTYSATGDVYEGEFANDEITGSGVFKYSNGDLYEGSLLNSQKHGHGKFTYANGNVYEGNFQNDVRSGRGKFTWASGTVYEGDFADDLKNGYGIMSFESGDRYEGYFKDDMRDGEKGIYSWKDGERYNGTFRNNLMDTCAVDENGEFIKDSNGEYVHGEMATYTFTTGRTYRGYFIEGEAVGVKIDSNIQTD